jgi:hypothetical protein
MRCITIYSDFYRYPCISKVAVLHRAPAWDRIGDLQVQTTDDRPGLG